MSIKKEHIRDRRRRRRIKSRLLGTPDRPRLQVRKTNRYLYVQIIDDISGQVLVTRSSMTKEAAKNGKSVKNLDTARKLGADVAAAALEKGIKKIIFDRGLFVYHGKIKMLADSAREKGLEF